ncbi:hypothetical protein B0T21DRAFT_293747 [Apiosordaria backusii]|uniref:BZIP domain-containing protein n=1 Tax=Apiosordaria backusii TaxID=314023 RepID=A0AA40AXD8_9PEZI|nr:hypothetical protein B0T21DRAFT_293747 [Apiosordaria backusii]
MEYTHTAYFGGPQPYQFMGIPPPLTPAHSTSVASDDFNTTSPPEVYEQFPNGIPHEQFQNYDNFLQFNPAQTFPGPPTPPGQVPVPAPVQQQPHPINGAVPQARPPTVEILPNLSKIDFDELSRRQQGSNSEEDDLTPAQSRRKAQNRAAQRAFRERKERHVKDLETRLQETVQRQQETATENERLKKELAQRNTELEILRATSNANVGSPGSSATPIVTGPMSYNPNDFFSNVLQNHANKAPSHRIVTSDSGERLLAAGATWELIISHPLSRRGLVDIGSVSERIKPLAKCDGQGPVFEERAILMAIEQSVASGSDELL